MQKIELKFVAGTKLIKLLVVDKIEVYYVSVSYRSLDLYHNSRFVTKNKLITFNQKLIFLCQTLLVGLVNGSVNVNVVGFPRGLENDDIIEWKGQAANRRTMGVLIIKNEDSSKKFCLEVHGFRNRVNLSKMFSMRNVIEKNKFFN